MIKYAGVGSRDIDTLTFLEIKLIAKKLAEYGFILRSGGADGTDTAFETGHRMHHSVNMQIFLPWKNFNSNSSGYYPPSIDAYYIAAKHHPRWKWLNEATRKLMARNIHQILGPGLDDPVDLVICWTPDGCESHETRTNTTGGTGQAIAIASKLKIPVYNLKNEDSKYKIFRNYLSLKA
jgi:hypothetical protein